MGLRLKSQMAAFLFVLFGATILLVTYFNVSILSQSIREQAEQESLGIASQMGTFVREVIPDGGFNAEYIRVSWQGQYLANYFSQIPQFRVVKLYDTQGHEIFRYGESPEARPLIPKLVDEALLSGKPVHELWSREEAGPPGGASLETISPFYRGSVSLEYFRPLRQRFGNGREGGPIQAVMYLSLDSPFLVRRLQLIIVGNALLAILFLITAFIAINLWGEHAVNRPLNNLLMAQERLGRGDYTAHVNLDIPSANEMVVLTNSFNRMARELLEYQGALEEKTRRLEQVNTQYRELNASLEQQVEEKTQELREFFSLVTHDLRIPLAAIQGYADLLGRGEMTAKQARYLRGISSANAHLLELVRNLLDAVRFEAGQVQMLLEVFDLKGLVTEVVSNVSPAEEGAPARIHVELDLVDGRVYGDRTRVGRVLTNLLSNALRFSPEGEPVVVRARERMGQVEIEVCDRGPGIAPENLPYLFEKFRHFPSSDGPSSGMGLGLYIVRRILESHGRTIAVQSTVGQGTRFFFDLPLPPRENVGPDEAPVEGDRVLQP